MPWEGRNMKNHFYHGTASTNVPGILAHGLLPAVAAGCDAAAIDQGFRVGFDSLLTRAPHVYVTDSLHAAECFASIASCANPHSKPVVFRLDVPAHTVSTFAIDERSKMDGARCYRVPEPLPPSVIKAKLEADW